jgi:hypothetical protein
MLHPPPAKINTARRSSADIPSQSPPSPRRTHTKSAKVESDNRVDNQETDTAPDIHETGSAPDNEEPGSVPFDRMVWPRPAPDSNPGNLPKPIPDDAEWWYDQKARGERGKNRRYTGHVQRIGGTAGEKIRAELAAIIRDLLEWAQQQQEDAASQNESREDGGADGLAE